MRRALAGLAGVALAACSGTPTKSTTCGTATDPCSDSTDCCTGFECIADVCSFVGGGNNNGGGNTGEATTTSGGSGPSSSGGHGSSGGGLIGGGTSGGGIASATSTSAGGSTGHTTGFSSAGTSSGGQGPSSSSSSGGSGGLCTTCSSDANCADGYCVFDGVSSTTYCAPACTAGCPGNAPCSFETDVNDGEIDACYPSSGTCSCGANPPPCESWVGSPDTCLDLACNSSSGTSDVCAQNGTCVPNCNDDTGYCGSEACDSDGHCETSGGTSSSGGSTGGSSSGGSTGGTINVTELCSEDCDTTGTDADCTDGWECIYDAVSGNAWCAPPCDTGTCPSADPCQAETDDGTFGTVNVCYPSSDSCG